MRAFSESPSRGGVSSIFGALATLSWLTVPDAVARLAACDVPVTMARANTLFDCLESIRGAHKVAHRMSGGLTVHHIILSSIEGRSVGSQAVAEILARSKRLQSHLRAIGQNMSKVMCPFEHASGEITMEAFAVGRFLRTRRWSY